MTVLLSCLAIFCGPQSTAPPTSDNITPPSRGGVARLIARGGEAKKVTLARELATFEAFVCIHGHEAAWNDSDDPYWGGLQMDKSFMRAYGRDMLAKYRGRWADAWTPADQIIVADRAHKTRGFGPWPNTRIPCGV